uniref:Uncharacterized protein n=1 Tax=Setaria italica TaxID=4555 RepID=K3XTC0_SETIT
DKNISVLKFLTNNIIEDQFYLPLSEQAFQEFQSLQVLIQGIQVHEGNKDSWQSIWGSNNYSSKKFYNFSYIHVRPPEPFL